VSQDELRRLRNFCAYISSTTSSSTVPTSLYPPGGDDVAAGGSDVLPPGDDAARSGFGEGNPSRYAWPQPSGATSDSGPFSYSVLSMAPKPTLSMVQTLLDSECSIATEIVACLKKAASDIEIGALAALLAPLSTQASSQLLDSNSNSNPPRQSTS